MKISKILFFIAGAVLATLLTWWLVGETRTTTKDEQSTLDVIMTRTSIRSYQDRPVGADTVELLLRAAMAAPSAMNRQPWVFVVVDDKMLLQQFADSLPYAKMVATAPLAIVVCGDLNKIPNSSDIQWSQDASAASENLLLAAHAMGLGAVWTGVYPRIERVKAVQNILNLPDNIIPLNVIPIGYPAENPTPKQKWDPSKVYHNSWAK